MKLNLYDENLKRIAAIEDRFVSCFWSEGYNTLESFVVELQDTEEYRKKVRPGCFVGRSDRNTVMVITTVEIKNGRISASGFPATRLLKDVSALDAPAHRSVAFKIYQAYESSESKNPLLIVKSPEEVDPGTVYADVSHDNMLELCETVCQGDEVGFKVTKEGTQLVLSIYRPEENAKLVYSENYGNLSVGSITFSTENFKNYAIVLGPEFLRFEIDETNGDYRRDLIVHAENETQNENDYSYEGYLERLQDMGRKALLEHRKTWECAFTPLADDFGKKFDLGDILTVLLPDMGMTLKARVSRFTQKEQNNQTKTTIEVGQITIKKG